MLILALDSSAVSASCALLEDDKLIAEAFVNTALTHSRTLLPMIESMLRNAERKPEQIDLFAVTTGPGSFTGVRIGVSTVKGMAYALGKPCVGLSTLEIMAEGCVPLFSDYIVCAAMDARCKQVYNALFLMKDGSYSRLTEDRAISLDALCEELKVQDKPILLVGDGAQICYDACAQNGIAAQLAPVQHRHQHACSAAVLSSRHIDKAVNAHELAVNYLRPPQAVRALSKSEKE